MKKLLFFLIGIMKLILNMKQIDDEYRNRRIIINCIKSDFSCFAIDVYLGLLCAARGASVEVVIDDNTLWHHDFVQLLEKRDYINPLVKYRYKIRYYFFALAFGIARSRKIKIVKTSKIRKIIKQDLQAISQLDKNELHLHAVDSCNRYFQGTLDNTSTIYKDYYDKSIENAELSYLIGVYAVSIIKATHFYTSHGIYSCWGPAFYYVRQYSNIVTLVYGVNTYFSNKLFISGEKLQCTSADSRLKQYMLSPITNAEKLAAELYINQRFNITTKDTSVYYKSALNHLELDRNQTNILLCPNVFWDGDIKDRNTLFENMTTWIIETVNVAIQNPDQNYYIRFHPAEVTWYENCVQFCDILSQKIPGIEEIPNLFLLRSDVAINLYTCLHEFNVIILYDGMLAIEAAYVEVPVILVGNGRYNVKDFALQPSSIEEYKSLLRQAHLIPNWYDTKYNKGRALQILSWYLNTASVDWDTLDNNDGDFGTSLMKISNRSFSKENSILYALDKI